MCQYGMYVIYTSRLHVLLFIIIILILPSEVVAVLHATTEFKFSRWTLGGSRKCVSCRTILTLDRLQRVIFT